MNVSENNSKKIDKVKTSANLPVHLIEPLNIVDKKENDKCVSAQICIYCGENFSEGLKNCPFCGVEIK